MVDDRLLAIFDGPARRFAAQLRLLSTRCDSESRRARVCTRASVKLSTAKWQALRRR
jgi:hypothetical protein